MPNGDWEEECESVFCQELRKGAAIKANKLRPGRVRNPVLQMIFCWKTSPWKQ